LLTILHTEVHECSRRPTRSLPLGLSWHNVHVACLRLIYEHGMLRTASRAAGEFFHNYRLYRLKFDSQQLLS